MNWSDPHLRTLITLALREDSARDDVTTQAIVHAPWWVRAELRAKQAGVIAGLPLAAMFFRAMDRRSRLKTLRKDGTHVRPGQVIAEVEGPARAILAAERPALNSLQHLSGIATYTANQVARLRSRRTKLFDTRKTLPGWRMLEKYAVRCGGGYNHRMSLGEAVLVKDNHLKLSRDAKADWKADLRLLRKRRPDLLVEVEVQSLRDLQDVIDLKPHWVLLDNFDLPNLRKVVARLRRKAPRVKIEVSGGISSEQIGPISRLGVDRISMGRLTHSAPTYDCSLEIVHVDAR